MKKQIEIKQEWVETEMIHLPWSVLVMGAFLNFGFFGYYLISIHPEWNNTFFPLGFFAVTYFIIVLISLKLMYKRKSYIVEKRK